MDNDLISQQEIEAAFSNYQRAVATGYLSEVRDAYYQLIQTIEVAKYRGSDVVDIEQTVTEEGSAGKLIRDLRFVLSTKFAASKIEDARCKCSKGRKGKLGKRDTASGMVEVNLRRGGSVKCLDIGIGERAESSEVIAYIPSKSQTGFVDYKG